MRPAHDDISHWLGAYLHWSQLAVSITPPPPPTPPHPPAPPPVLFPSMQWNQYDNALGCFVFLYFYHWSMYWAYSITLYCTVTYREYHIATVKFVIPNHFHHSQYLYWLLKSNWRCSVTQRCSLDMSLILCHSSMPSSDYLKMVGMDKYATLKMKYICFRIIAWDI